MGAPGATRGKPEDTLMTSDGKIVPYRMSVLMEIAAKVAKTMVTGAVSLSYEEMEIVLDYIHLNIEHSKGSNEAREKENRDVSEDK